MTTATLQRWVIEMQDARELYAKTIRNLSKTNDIIGKVVRELSDTPVWNHASRQAHTDYFPNIFLDEIRDFPFDGPLEEKIVVYFTMLYLEQ